jgi:tetratricopeptide (TPR) repeat protein
MKTAKFFVVVLLSYAIGLIIAYQARKITKEFNQAKAMLLQVSMKADSAAMVQARQRFEQLLQNPQVTENDSLAAWTHYYVAFANWQMGFVTFGDRNSTTKLMEEALAHLRTAIKLKGNLIDAYAVSRRCSYWLYTLDPSRAKPIWQEVNAAFKKAQVLAPDHPRVKFEEAIELFYKPPQAGGNQEQGLKRFREAAQGFERQSTADKDYEDWWRATTYMFLGQAYLGVEQPEEAEKAFQAALAIQPNFAMVKNGMLPMTQLMTPPLLRSFKGVAWTQLATDAENDGRNPNWADVKALSYFYEAPHDTLWLKFDLSRLPNQNAFGVNLAVDTDQNQQNGANWWGSNRAFKYDKLVTVWVIKAEGQSYRGTVGIADARGVQLGRYTNLFRNNLAFRAEGDTKTMWLGFKSADLDNDGSFAMIAAVGSNVGWNDDITDSAAIAIELIGSK